MRSLRTKITLLTVLVIVVALAIVTFLSVMFIRRTEHRKSDQLLLLLCEIGERNLDYYFDSVEHSVEKVARFVQADLDGLEDEKLAQHVDRVLKYFDEMAYKTNGVLTYYYRLDPAVSDTVKGFWYTNVDGEGLVPHEVTDITLYDTNDTSALVWFTVPKYEHKSIWLPPYITDNLDVRVISYNVPIYYKQQFVGVIGIEIDYSTMAEQVENIRLYTNGYDFINDSEGNLIYHPHIDVALLTDETRPVVPEGLLDESTFVSYTYDGVEREAAWLELSNGMRLNVTVPVRETEGEWQQLVFNILVASAEVLLVMSFLTFFLTKLITRPIEELTMAAEQVDKGNYDFTLNYQGNDEVGRLTSTFKHLSSHMEAHITDLNNRVYVDALTSVRNKGGYAAVIEKLQKEMDADPQIEFAMCVFDCDDLKSINDHYGHDKGDIYLKTASSLICRVFKHSPVFRIGGDEFAVLLQNDDLRNRDELIRIFDQEKEEISRSKQNKWEQVHIAMGIAVYDPEIDRTVIEVARRADKKMYANKRESKHAHR